MLSTASAYWHALRWDYPDRATRFVEEGPAIHQATDVANWALLFLSATK